MNTTSNPAKHVPSSISPSEATSKGQQKSLLIGIVLFALIKLLLVSFGLGSKEGPRLGDDAYVYLYYGELAQTSAASLPGPASLLAAAPQDSLDAATEEEQFRAHRVLMRTTGSQRLFSLWPISLIPAAELSFYQSWWLYELCVVAVMSWGLYTLIGNLGLLQRTWLALPLIAMATFPGQGLHFFIPSTLALSFGMAIWGLAFGPRPRPLLMFGCAVGALLSHAIGLAHIAIGLGLVLALWLSGQRTLERALRECGVLVLALVSVLGLISASNVDVGVNYDFTRLGLSVVGENLSHLPVLLRRFADRDLIAALFCLIGLVALLRRRGAWSFWIFPHDRLQLLALSLVVVLLASSIYIIDGYPAEVQLRFLAPLLVLLILAACDAWTWSRFARVKKGLMGLALVLGGGTALDKAVDNRDVRWPELSRQALAARIDALPPGSRILYLDQDYALMGGFLAGGTDHAAYVPALLVLDPEQSEQTLQANPPDVAIGLVPYDLRTRQGLRWPLTAPGIYGFDLEYEGTLVISTTAEVEGLTIRWRGEAAPTVARPGRPACGLSEASPHNYTVDPACLEDLTSDTLVITGPGIVTGLLLPLQPDALNWPWGGPLEADYHPGRDGPWAPDAFQTTFALQDLVTDETTWDAVPILDAMVPIADDGGFVWLTGRP